MNCLEENVLLLVTCAMSSHILLAVSSFIIVGDGYYRSPLLATRLRKVVKEQYTVNNGKLLSQVDVLGQI